MTSKPIPKDLGVKIGTKKQVIWERVKKEAEILIQESEDNLIIQKGMLALAENNIAAEKEKI